LQNPGEIAPRECEGVLSPVIARSDSDEAIQLSCRGNGSWIASRSLSSGAHSRDRWLAMTVLAASAARLKNDRDHFRDAEMTAIMPIGLPKPCTRLRRAPSSFPATMAVA